MKPKNTLITPALFKSALAIMIPRRSRQAVISSHEIAICFLSLVGVLVIATRKANGTSKKCTKLMALGAPTALIMRGKKAVAKAVIINVKLVRYTFFVGLRNCLFTELLLYML
ncbi:hypothetical protein [Scytonema sp. HK-05]|uniref:hypothetical protein n=1 Tax=Scytonema sp. HK-05 TaxID=1137095 RepID=UPI001E455B6D|nr:hypothetical protein [Scytonema sp. HK-05]